MLKIITDSSSNITQEEAQSLGITVLPLTLSFGNEELRDGIDIGYDEFYARLASSKEFPHTSQLAEAQVEEAVKAALKEADEVLLLPLAAALSGSYERCCKVAEKYPNVFVHETKSTTVMLKAMVLEALKNQQKSAKEVCAILQAFRSKLKIFAALDTLENLRKGGRLSKTAALLGSVLKIKPVITFDADGGVELISKQFGIAKGLSFVASQIDVKKIDFTKPVYYIYTGDDRNCKTLMAKLNIEYTEMSNICPVIGSHIGAAAAGIVFAEK